MVVEVIKRERLNVSRYLYSKMFFARCRDPFVQFLFWSMKWRTTSPRQWMNHCFSFYSRAPISHFPVFYWWNIICIWWTHGEKSNRRIYGSKFISGEIERIYVCVCVCVYGAHFKQMQNDLAEQFAFNRLLRNIEYWTWHVSVDCRNANVVWSLFMFKYFRNFTKKQKK